jgi:hypothetical protein
MNLESFDPGLPLRFGHTITPVSLELPATLTAQQWHEVGATLQRVDEARQWWLGDWWNAGVKWGQGREACAELGLSYDTVSASGHVAKHIEFCRRRQNLPFSHHREVCAITEPEVQDRFLLWCEETLETTGKTRSIRELREAIKSHMDNQGWTDFERARRHWVEHLGYPTLANHHTDTSLLQWAKMTGRHVYIGRGSKWSNPFELGKDGDREYVIDSYCLQLFSPQAVAAGCLTGTRWQSPRVLLYPRTLSRRSPRGNAQA